MTATAGGVSVAGRPPAADRTDVPCRQRQFKPDWWFPERGDRETARLAKSLCRRCPARWECLLWAVEHERRHGIFGATDARQRREMWRAEQQRKAVGV